MKHIKHIVKFTVEFLIEVQKNAETGLHEAVVTSMIPPQTYYGLTQKEAVEAARRGAVEHVSQFFTE